MTHRTSKSLAAAALTFTLTVPSHAQDAMKYQKPPAPIEALLDAPQSPVASLSPDRKLLLIQQPQTFPTIADVAQPRFRLAGLRFNPATNGPSRTFDVVGFTFQPLSGDAPKPILGLPSNLRATGISWSPDSKHIAFVQRSHNALELWIITVSSAHAHRLAPAVALNAVLGTPYTWMPDSSALLCRIIPANRGPAPKPTSPSPSAKPPPPPPTRTCSKPPTTKPSSPSTPPPS
jgi:hypothetical protein